MAAIVFFVIIWYTSLFFQTFFLHRYAAHGAFKMSKLWERVFYIFTYAAQGSSYMSPRVYAVMHRIHHAYTDTEQDPHSPHFSKNIFQMMWRTRTIYNKIYRGQIEVEDRFNKNLPDWNPIDRLGHSTLSRIGWALFYITVFILLSSPWWAYCLLPVILTMGAFHGAIVNWFAHKYGYVNFKVKNTSRNLLSIDVLMLGESYHNNHHRRPSAINFGRRWHEIDPVYPIIKLLDWLGIIHLTKQPLHPVEPTTERIEPDPSH